MAMEQLSNLNLPDRLKALQRSEAFPAIVAAFAGGLLGGIAAARIGGTKTRIIETVRDDSQPAPRKSGLLGFAPSDIIQLITVSTGLLAQVKAWREEANAKQVISEQTGIDLQ